jgi:hypothetical protein
VGWQVRWQQAVVMWGWRPACSFSVLWCGEALHGLGVQGAKVLALPSALPLPSMVPCLSQVPDSQSSQSATVSQLPFWIPLSYLYFLKDFGPDLGINKNFSLAKYIK